MKTFHIVDEVQTPLREAVEAQPSELFKAQTRMVDLIKKNNALPDKDGSVLTPKVSIFILYWHDLLF